MEPPKPGLAALESAISRIEGRLDRLDGKMDALDGRLRIVEQKMAGIEGKIDLLVTSVVGTRPSWWQIAIAATISLVVAGYAAAHLLRAHGPQF